VLLHKASIRQQGADARLKVPAVAAAACSMQAVLKQPPFISSSLNSIFTNSEASGATHVAAGNHTPHTCTNTHCSCKPPAASQPCVKWQLQQLLASCLRA
jgi:hypothetical protein